MSVYFVRGNGYRFDFTVNGRRYTSGYFKKKGDAKKAEAKKRQEIANPPGESRDLPFYELMQRRLAHLQVYASEGHFKDTHAMGKRAVRRFKKMLCSEITPEMVEKFIRWRAKQSSPHAANRDLVYLRSAFRWGSKKRFIDNDPTFSVEFFPVEKRVKYVPTPEEVDKIIAVAEPEVADYIWVIRETLARVSEINRMQWSDVNLRERYVVLWTRKKRGGVKTPRRIPMTTTLFEILTRRFRERNRQIPYVFWHRYWSRKEGKWKVGPYGDRSKIMRTLCKNAKVKYFRYHAIRASQASVVAHLGTPLLVVSHLLGHNNSQVTELYISKVGAGIDKAARDALVKYEEMRRNSTKVPQKSPHQSENLPD